MTTDWEIVSGENKDSNNQANQQSDLSLHLSEPWGDVAAKLQYNGPGKIFDDEDSGHVDRARKPYK